jgi:mannose/fructose/N-acetylgalactosamine-specific phosphotransferase system component IIC
MEILTLSLAAAILALDTSAVFQVLISQPLISGTILGWLGGSPAVGMQIGFLTQLLWMANLPVGAARVPESNGAAMIATILAIQLNAATNIHRDTIILFVIIYALILSYLGADIVRVIRTWNISLVDRILKFVENDRSSSLGIVITAAILLLGAAMFVFIFAGVWAGKLIFTQLLDQIPPDWNNYARYVQIALLGCGVGLTIHLYRENRHKMIIAAAGVVGFALSVFMH